MCSLEKYEEMKAYVKDTEKQRDQVRISYVQACMYCTRGMYLSVVLKICNILTTDVCRQTPANNTLYNIIESLLTGVIRFRISREIFQ